jgi:serine/threonine protein phosphatase PrpC
MKISAASICKQGGREYNQDFVSGIVNGTEACIVVCDGLGSYVGSEVASRLCATKIVELYSKLRETEPERAYAPETVQSYIHAAHNYVSDYKDHTPEIKSSCTTVACCVTDGSKVTMSHIGDTRIYLFRGGKLAYQSKDHSLSQLAVEMGQIDLRDIRTHKDQNKLTRVLGGAYYIEPDCEISAEPLGAGDAIIMCTDGFWEYVYEEEMEAELAASDNAEEILAKLEKRLLSRITKFNDNYSAVVAKVITSEKKEVADNGKNE